MSRKTGICPVCDGSGYVHSSGSPWSDVIEGLDQNSINKRNSILAWRSSHDASECSKCMNCGAQYPNSYMTGRTELMADGTPCTHSYTQVVVNNSVVHSKCLHCGDEYYTEIYNPDGTPGTTPTLF